jgi:hypothetical protein
MSKSNDNTWCAAAKDVAKGLWQTQKDLVKTALGREQGKK